MSSDLLAWHLREGMCLIQSLQRQTKKAKDNSTIYRQFEELGNEFLTLLEKNKSALSTLIHSFKCCTDRTSASGNFGTQGSSMGSVCM